MDIENEIETTETELFDNPEAVVEAIESKELSFSKVPKERRDEVRGLVIKKALDKAIEEENSEMEFALKNGYSPEILFGGKKKNGSPITFKTPEEFNKTIRENSPVLNERLKTMAKELEESRREARKATELAKMNFERSLNQDEQSIDAKLREARDNGDFDTYDDLLIKKADLIKGKERLKEYEPEVKVQTEVQPEVKEWGARNQWFWSDNQMKQWAIGQEDLLRATRPDLDLSGRLELITQTAKISFADRFPVEKKGADVLPSRNSGSMSVGKKTELTFSQLPENEKSQARQMIRQKVFKDETDFMKDYNKLIK